LARHLLAITAARRYPLLSAKQDLLRTIDPITIEKRFGNSGNDVGIQGMIGKRSSRSSAISKRRIIGDYGNSESDSGASCHKEAATTRLLPGKNDALPSSAHAIAAAAVGTFPCCPGAAKIGGGTTPQRRGAENGSHVV
jgi:hypothetical protein